MARERQRADDAVAEADELRRLLEETQVKHQEMEHVVFDYIAKEQALATGNARDQRSRLMRPQERNDAAARECKLMKERAEKAEETLEKAEEALQALQVHPHCAVATGGGPAGLHVAHDGIRGPQGLQRERGCRRGARQWLHITVHTDGSHRGLS